MDELHDEAAQGDGADRPHRADDVELGLFAQMCYPGQNFDMSVPVPEGAALDEPGLLDLAERFHDQHEAERGFCFRNQQPLLRGVRLVAAGDTPKPDQLRRARHGRRTRRRPATAARPAYFGTEFVDTPVLRRRPARAGRRDRGARADRGAVHRRRRAAGRRRPRSTDLATTSSQPC